VLWDGRDNAGRAVSSGTYLYTIGREGFQTGGKMEIMK
jgi:hypothetical protein